MIMLPSVCRTRLLVRFLIAILLMLGVQLLVTKGTPVYSRQLTQEPGPYTVYLPIIYKGPDFADLTLINDTGGRLCFTLYGTGIGEKCFDGAGSHFYGKFTPGIYDYRVTAVCGVEEDSFNFQPGYSYEWKYYCEVINP